jgi:hypothetical protein
MYKVKIILMVKGVSNKLKCHAELVSASHQQVNFLHIVRLACGMPK